MEEEAKVTYVVKINNLPIAASGIVPGSKLDEKLTEMTPTEVTALMETLH